eukprot:PhF_6_TR27800/c0_g1_i1/m.40500
MDIHLRTCELVFEVKRAGNSQSEYSTALQRLYDLIFNALGNKPTPQPPPPELNLSLNLEVASATGKTITRRHSAHSVILSESESYRERHGVRHTTKNTSTEHTTRNTAGKDDATQITKEERKMSLSEMLSNHQRQVRQPLDDHNEDESDPEDGNGKVEDQGSPRAPVLASANQAFPPPFPRRGLPKSKSGPLDLPAELQLSRVAGRETNDDTHPQGSANNSFVEVAPQESEPEQRLVMELPLPPGGVSSKSRPLEGRSRKDSNLVPSASQQQPEGRQTPPPPPLADSINPNVDSQQKVMTTDSPGKTGASSKSRPLEGRTKRDSKVIERPPEETPKEALKSSSMSFKHPKPESQPSKANLKPTPQRLSRNNSIKNNDLDSGDDAVAKDKRTTSPVAGLSLRDKGPDQGKRLEAEKLKPPQQEGNDAPHTNTNNNATAPDVVAKLRSMRTRQQQNNHASQLQGLCVSMKQQLQALESAASDLSASLQVVAKLPPRQKAVEPEYQYSTAHGRRCDADIMCRLKCAKGIK